jgi:hypothetical protein
MDAMQALTVIGVAIANIGTTITLFLWATSRAAEDKRDLMTRASEDKMEITNLIRAIQEEMKDFHGRLCAIEERNRK